MSDNDAYAQPAAREEYDRERSPRVERERERERSRSPVRRERSASPRRNGGDDRRDRAPAADEVNPGNNLHVSGLSRAVDVPMLEDLFGKAGKVQKASIMYDPHSRESRGFGFVMMDTPEDAEAAISQCSGVNLEGKTISVTHAKRARPRSPTPGRYHGVKMDGPPGYRGGGGYDRPYQPRSYDSRYSDRGPPPSRYDDRDRRYDDRSRYDDRPRYDRYERDAPREREYVPRGPPSGERGYDRRDERPRYDDRRY